MDAKKQGGARDGAGRKKVAGTGPIMKSVKLSQEHWEMALTLGAGNMAEGIRRALDVAESAIWPDGKEGKSVQRSLPCEKIPGGSLAKASSKGGHSSSQRLDWDEYGMSLARAVAAKSKDKSTQVGCVILDPEHRVVSTGFNGLPRYVPDDPAILGDRDTKLALVIHAEENALLFARQSLEGCTAYVWPMPPCSRCAAKLAQVGIMRVVAPKPTPERIERWGASMRLSDWLYHHAGIDYAEVTE